MKKRGFTLIELLVVVAIISLLSSIILASINHVRAKARDTKRISDIRAVEQALELYRNDYGSYPSTVGKCSNQWCSGCSSTEGLNNGMPQLVTGKYISALPKDPRPTVTGGTGCFNYEYYSQPGTIRARGSWWACNNKPVGQYQYVIRFQLEVTPATFSMFHWDTYTTSRLYDYCIFK